MKKRIIPFAIILLATMAASACSEKKWTTEGFEMTPVYGISQIADSEQKSPYDAMDIYLQKPLMIQFTDNQAVSFQMLQFTDQSSGTDYSMEFNTAYSVTNDDGTVDAVEQQYELNTSRSEEQVDGQTVYVNRGVMNVIRSVNGGDPEHLYYTIVLTAAQKAN